MFYLLSQLIPVYTHTLREKAAGMDKLYFSSFDNLNATFEWHLLWQTPK
jgi:hypothetical protein